MPLFLRADRHINVDLEQTYPSAWEVYPGPLTGLTQGDLGKRMKKPQSWVFNCETANRRVDVTEFIAWARSCDVAPDEAFARFLKSGSSCFCVGKFHLSISQKPRKK